MNGFEKKYDIHVIKSNDHDKKKEFIDDCEKIYRIKNNTFCCIDIEFNNTKNTRYIAFMQIMFIFNSESYKTDEKIPIYVFDPATLSNDDINKFIKYVLCSNVIKIFHGSDSLDFPHIYADILKNDKMLFGKFLNKCVDTRFLCEISKRLMDRLGIKKNKSNSDIANKKCSIYYSLFDHDVIDKKLFDQYMKIESKINYNKIWSIDTITENELNYSVIDVIHLFDLLYTIANRVLCHKQDQEQNQEQEEIRENDILSLVTRLYRYCILHRLGLIDITNQAIQIFSKYKLSSDALIDLNQKILETPLFNCVYRHTKDNTISITIDDIASIDTIRKPFMALLLIYRLDQSETDIGMMDKMINDNDILNKSLKSVKGALLYLIYKIKTKIDSMDSNIECNRSFLEPSHKKL